jgi:membrane fusion protein (multidrug efflux system)
MKHIVWMVPLVAVSLLSCQNDQKKESLEVFPVTTAALIDTNAFVDYVAEIKAVQNVEIRAKLTGYLEKVHVDEGAHVKAGQLLFSIDDREYKEQLAKRRALLKSAQAEVKSNELEVQNTRQLVEKGVVSKIELEFAKNKLLSSKAKVEEAMAEEEHARLVLSYTKIKAPFDGIIDRLPIKIGSLIAEGTLLTNLSQNNEVFAYFDVSEKEYLDFMSKLTRKGTQERSVSLVKANGDLHEVSGFIETMDGQIDDQTGNLAFRARFKNPQELLKHGSTGKVRIAKKFKKVLVIPQKSTIDIQDKTYVYVVNRSGKLSIRPITIAYRLPHLYVISKGLSSKDTFVYEGLQLVNDGMMIRKEAIPIKKILRDLSKF